MTNTAEKPYTLKSTPPPGLGTICYLSPEILIFQYPDRDVFGNGFIEFNVSSVATTTTVATTTAAASK